MDCIQEWSTRDVPSTEVASYWSDVLTGALRGLRVEFPSVEQFQGTLRNCAVGRAGLNLVTAGPQRVVIPNQHFVGGADRDYFDLIYLQRGRLSVRHYTQLSTLLPGQCVLIDGTEEAAVLTTEPSSSLTVRVPRGLMLTWIARPERLAGRALTAETLRMRALLAHLDTLTVEYGSSPGTVDRQMVGEIPALLRLITGKQEEGTSKHASKLVLRLKELIAETYFDPDFKLSTAAAQFGISRRYAVALFCNEGTTFCATLMRIRLENAAAMLRDERFATVSVVEIGWRCGFRDASHFSRRFREKFGRTPSAFRSTGQSENGRRVAASEPS